MTKKLGDNDYIDSTETKKKKQTIQGEKTILSGKRKGAKCDQSVKSDERQSVSSEPKKTIE